MATEVEKKYRLTSEQRASLERRLEEMGAEAQSSEEFEVNTLYAGNGLDRGARVLRLRRVGGRALLTYKERFDSGSPIKRHREDETEVADADALAAILEGLGYSASLIYEKRRRTWHVAGVELVMDELPFGLFAEIEGEADAILAAERLLGLADAEAVHETYPQLAARHAPTRDGLIEARFSK